MKKDVTNKIIDYLMLALLLAISGFPFFNHPNFWIIVLFVILIVTIKRRQLSVLNNNLFLSYAFIFFSLILMQSIKFSILSYTTLFGLLIKITLSFLVFKLIGIKVIDYYVRIIVFFALISFIFWIPNLLLGMPFEITLTNSIAKFFPELFREAGSFYQYIPNIIIYSFNSFVPGQLIARNSGPFWEPGAFAGYIIIAILFNFIQRKEIINKQNIVLMIALITTFSTTGYIALAFIVLFFVFSNYKWYMNLLLIPLIVLTVIFGYKQIPFLEQKITYQLQINKMNRHTGTRFVNALRDLEDFAEDPLIGKGQNKATRFDSKDPRLIHRNNGVTNFLVNWGIIGFIYYFVYIYLSFSAMCGFYNINRLFAVFAFAAILLIGFSETYFNRPFFIGFIFLYDLFNVKNNNENSPNHPNL